jgi:L-rhamnose mutarotase
MLAILKTLKLKIYAIFLAAFGFLLLVLKIKNNKINELKEENAMQKKKAEIEETIDQAETKAEEDEDEIISKIDDSDWHDHI